MLPFPRVNLSPQIFMDDIARMAANRDSAQYANNLPETLIGNKSLQFNLEKSGFLVMGNKKARHELHAQIEESPLTLCEKTMKEVKVLKYLGDYLSFSLEDSVHQTVTKRAAVARMAIYEIRTVIEDTRADSLGALNLAFMFWEQSVLPMLTFNCESWLGIQRKSVKVLDDLFHTFCRIIFRVSASCPILSFYWQSCSLKMENLILEQKLNFARHLANVPEGEIGRTVIDIQIDQNIGLFRELKEHLTHLGIHNLQSVSKWQFRKTVKNYIFEKNKSELLSQIKGYKKLSYEELSRETFERKPYFFNLSLENARMRFRVASKLVPTVLMNFPSKYRRIGRPLTCPSCSRPSSTPTSSSLTRESAELNNSPDPLHSQTHILTDCMAVNDPSAECDPDDDTSLVVFFRKVVARHMEMEDQLFDQLNLG